MCNYDATVRKAKDHADVFYFVFSYRASRSFSRVFGSLDTDFGTSLPSIIVTWRSDAVTSAAVFQESATGTSCCRCSPWSSSSLWLKGRPRTWPP